MTFLRRDGSKFSSLLNSPIWFDTQYFLPQVVTSYPIQHLVYTDLQDKTIYSFQCFKMNKMQMFPMPY